MKKFNELLLEFFEVPSKGNYSLPPKATKVFTASGRDGKYGGTPIDYTYTSYHVPITDREGKEQNLWVHTFHYPNGERGDLRKVPHTQVHFDVSHVTPKMFWDSRAKQNPSERIENAYYSAFGTGHTNTVTDITKKQFGPLVSPRWVKPMIDILWHHHHTNPHEGSYFVAGAGGDKESSLKRFQMYDRILKVLDKKNLVKREGSHYSDQLLSYPLMHAFTIK